MGSDLSREDVDALVHSPECNRVTPVDAASGRLVTWAECGALDGIPCLYFPGVSGSRYVGVFAHHAAARAGIRLIVLDYPGVGGSTPLPGRTLSQWAEDVASLVCRVPSLAHAPTLYVLGVSAGAVHAMHVAAHRDLRDRVRAMALMAPWIPPSHQCANWLAKASSWVPAPLLSGLSAVSASVPTMMEDAMTVERAEAIFGASINAEELRLFQLTRQEAIRNGTDGVRETALLCTEKNGPLTLPDRTHLPSDIRVISGHGDLLVSVEAAQSLAFLLGAQTHFIDGVNHSTIPMYVPDALSWLATCQPTAVTAAPAQKVSRSASVSSIPPIRGSPVRVIAPRVAKRDSITDSAGSATLGERFDLSLGTGDGGGGGDVDDDVVLIDDDDDSAAVGDDGGQA